MRRIMYLIAPVIVVLGLAFPVHSYAQSDKRCFNVPGISNCIAGRIREYWEQNGGLQVFGYPITDQHDEVNRDTGKSYATQYFERNRFELHPDQPRPYDVLLGRLGDDRLHQQDRDWHGFGQGKKQDGCLFFEETQHSICDLGTGLGFKSYWEGHGLQDPALSPFQRSLALFGLPLSEYTIETNAAGDTVLTQWFERARFEYHLDKPREFRVLLGLLGNETRNPPPPQPVGNGFPVPSPLPASLVACEGVPLGDHGVALGNCVHAGESLTFGFFGLGGNADVQYSIATAAGSEIGSAQTTRLDANGSMYVTVNTANYGGSALPAGDYVLNARSNTGGTAHVPFRIIQ